MDVHSKRLIRARTKENNFDESLKNLLDQEFGKYYMYVVNRDSFRISEQIL